MDTRDASWQPDAGAETTPSDDMSVDWSVSELFGEETPAPEPLPADGALTLPEDVFGNAPHDAEPEPDVTLDPQASADDPVDSSPFVLDDLFPATTEAVDVVDDTPEDDWNVEPGGSEAPAREPTQAKAPNVVVGDLFATHAASRPAPKPRLAPETAPSRRRPEIDLRKLWIPSAIAVVVVAVSMAVTQRRDPSVDVRSAATPQPTRTVPPSTAPTPTTAAATGSTGVTSPTTTAEPAPTSAAPSPSPATGATVTTAATGATVGPAPVTTQARPPAGDAPATTATTTAATTAATVADTVVFDPPPPDTTPTTRRPRATVPPTTSATTTTVASPDDEELDGD